MYPNTVLQEIEDDIGYKYFKVGVLIGSGITIICQLIIVLTVFVIQSLI